MNIFEVIIPFKQKTLWIDASESEIPGLWFVI